MNALQVESDAQNTHMLLGGLLHCVQDSAVFEETETNTELYQSSPAPSDANLLSSGMWFFAAKFIFRFGRITLFVPISIFREIVFLIQSHVYNAHTSKFFNLSVSNLCFEICYRFFVVFHGRGSLRSFLIKIFMYISVVSVVVSSF